MCFIKYNFEISQNKKLKYLTIKTLKIFMKHFLLLILFAITASQGFSQTSSLFFSEYIEGSSSNKYLEIYNGTGSDVDLSGYKVNLYTNGATEATCSDTLSGTLANGDVFIIANSSADAFTGTVNLYSTVTYYNGNDAIALMTINGDYVDIIGCIGESVYWSDGDYSLKDQSLIRKSSVTSGITENPSSGFPTLTTEWDLYDKDEVSYLGSYPLSESSVEAPTFSVDEGTYTTSQSIELSTTTNGATIYYTTDGTDPDNTSLVYSSAIAISETTTIKAIAYYNAEYSSISDATYTISSLQTVTDLGALRSSYDESISDVVYSVSGTVYVSAIDNSGNLYVQDDNGAILVYDSNDVLTTSHSIGDAITNLTGSLTEYSGTLELIPTEDATTSSTDNSISATTATISELNSNWEDYESRLITVNSVSFDSEVAGTTVTSYTTYTITDSESNTLSLYPKFTDLVGASIPSSANVTGIAVLYSSAPEICPRDADDIVGSTTSVNQISQNTAIFPNPFNDLVTIESQNIKTVQLSNLTGNVVEVINATGTEKVSISTSDLSKGIYIIKVIKEDGSSLVKKIIKK